MSNLFILVALLCSDANHCEYYALDHSLSAYDCDAYFTDSGVMTVDNLVGIVENEKTVELSIKSLECVQEGVE